MIKEMTLINGQGRTTETVLWRGVIARTIQDWLSPPLRPKREAERYLFEDSADLSLVCKSAGIDVGRLRTCLDKVRGRTLLDLVPECRSNLTVSPRSRKEAATVFPFDAPSGSDR